MKVHGEYPDILFRSFGCIEHAQQFLSGNIRFGSVLGYRKAEDERRRDETEGTGHYTTDGVDSKTEFCTNVVYTLCCHRDIEAAKNASYGKYIIEIANPLYLAEELTRLLRNLSSKHFGGIEGVYVDYDKGEEKGGKLNSYANSRLTYSQKPKTPFYKDKEFRFVFIRKKYAGNNIYLQLNNGIGGGAIYEYS